MSVSAEEVRAAYLMFLGREPENGDVIAEKLGYPDLIALGEAFRHSKEFKSNLPPGFQASKWVAVDVLDRFVQWIDLHDNHVSRGCLRGDWEPNETAYFSGVLNAGDVVLDVGANVGWFSLVAAKHIGPNGRVHSFEPRPETGRALKRTIADNHLQSIIQLWPYALSDRVAELNLVWGLDTNNPGGSFLSSSSPIHTEAESARVLTVSLDCLLPDVAPDVVKLDIEGAEPLAIRGMANALSRKHPPILSELHVVQLAVVSQTTPSAYIEQLGALGYACFLLENGCPSERLYDMPADRGDLVSVVFEWRPGL